MSVRLVCTVVAMFLLPSLGSAQSGLRSASLPDRGPTDPLTRPMLLRSASLPDRTPSDPLPRFRRDKFLTSRFDRRSRRDFRRQQFPIGFGYVGDTYVPSDPSSESYPRPIEANGYLQLDVRPATAQVYVDGMFMGSVDDFRRLIPGRSLEPGAHRVELRAPGYDSLAFDVRIFPNETTTYRNDLVATRKVEQPAAPAPIPKTFYVIPGCYAGDKPPRAGSLRRGCNIANVRTVPPLVTDIRKPRG